MKVMILSVAVTDDAPTADADIILKIKYAERNNSAAHAFEIAAELIRSMEQLDRVLLQSIHPQLSTALIVEDLEKSSLKIFIRSVLEDVPDEALKEADLKSLVGHYLIKAKYAAIRWLDQEEESPKRIGDLTEEIAQLARESEARHLPDYPAPNPSRLAQPLDRFQETKKKFQEGEGLTITLGKEEYQVHVDRSWSASDTIDEADGDNEMVSEQDQYLTIGKPDFIGETKWAFKHGKKPVSYKIVDDEWLEEFRSGAFPIKPGDALRVRILVRNVYDARGNLLENEELITK
ncbi:hypothetical protein FZX02_04030, partial [Synechococcus sp. MU1644]|nr:hypothetical protein [Synechococcus sp. MU1644]